MVKCHVTYVTKCMADVILKPTSIKVIILYLKKTFANCGANFQKFYFHQFSTDFFYIRSLARELFLQSWLAFCENGPFVHYL